MDTQEEMRINKIYLDLDQQFIKEESALEPILNKFYELTLKATDEAMRVYRPKCQESFEEMQKYATIIENSELKEKDTKNEEKFYGAFIQNLECMMRNDKELERASLLLTENDRIYSDYYNSLLKCYKDSNQRSDKEISDCFIKSNSEYINSTKGMVERLTNDFSSLITRFEKL